MAKRKKMTGFARLIIALLIIVPAAFVGASYVNGEDPVQKFKELVGWEEPRSNGSQNGNSNSRSSGNSSASTSGSTNYDDMSRSELLREVRILDERLARCRAENVD